MPIRIEVEIHANLWNLEGSWSEIMVFKKKFGDLKETWKKKFKQKEDVTIYNQKFLSVTVIR